MPENPDKPSITDPTRIITLSNGLSILRAFLALPIVYLLSVDALFGSVVVILVAMVTDFFDGFFARRAHQITNVGKILDPTADAIAVLSVALFISLDETRQFPSWFLIFFVVRYLTISLCGVYIMNRYSVTLSSNRVGKQTLLVSAVAILLYVIRVESVGIYLILAATVLASVSWLQYMKSYVAYFRK